MRHFTCVQDLGDLKQALNEAFEIKKDRFQFSELGKNKTLLMIFFNSSLRTRLSTQKAAMNLGMNTIVLDVNQGAWKLETERGVIMDGDKPEHLLEAVPVMGCYCDVIGVRSFARFENKEDDYNEKILSQFIEHSGRPVFSMEYDQKKAFEGADFIYAKNWSAYKDPNYGQVISTDRSWTVDAEKMALTNNAYFMHCLPVRRNMIVSDDVIESPQSIVIPEAANREISAQTVLKKILMGLSNL